MNTIFVALPPQAGDVATFLGRLLFLGAARLLFETLHAACFQDGASLIGPAKRAGHVGQNLLLALGTGHESFLFERKMRGAAKFG